MAGVTAGPGRRGEFAFRLGRRELGRLHGDRVFHGGFPKPVWQELYDQGRIDYHPVFPGKPGFASRPIEGDEDVDDVIADDPSSTTTGQSRSAALPPQS